MANSVRGALLLAVLCVCAPAVNADAAAALHERLADDPFIKGRFSQQRALADIPNPIRSRGRFMIWRRHGLYWEIAEPLYHATTFTPEETYQWNKPGVAERMEAGAFQINRRISAIILALFEGDFDKLKEDFSVSLDDGAESWTMTLEPANRHIGKALERITVRGADHIQTVKMESGSGDVTSIELEVTAGGERPSEQDIDRLSPRAIKACCLSPEDG